MGYVILGEIRKHWVKFVSLIFLYVLPVFFPIFGPFFYLWLLDLIKGHYKWLEQTSVVLYVVLNKPGGWKSSGEKSWTGRRKFYIPLFDAINRRNEQPTTVNIIFSSI